LIMGSEVTGGVLVMRSGVTHGVMVMGPEVRGGPFFRVRGQGRGVHYGVRGHKGVLCLSWGQRSAVSLFFRVRGQGRGVEG